VARVPLTKLLRLDAGLDFEGIRNDIAVDAAVSGMPREGDSGMPGGGGIASDQLVLHTLGAAPYLNALFTLLDKHLLVNPGVRVEISSYSGYANSPDAFQHTHVQLEPRLAVRYQVNKYFGVKAAIGAYHQAPDASSFLKNFGNPSVNPETSYHYVLGLDVSPTATLHVEVDGFYKDMQSLVVRGSPGSGVLLDNEGIGRVYGGELLIRQQLWHHFYGWLSYTLSRAERRDHPSDAWRLFDFDQTHILSLIASYEFPHGVQVGVRFRYVTGNPTTPVASWWWDANGDTYQPIYGPTNSGRLDAFNQLDLRIDKFFTYRLYKWAVFVDIQNVYNAKNPETIQYAPRPEDGSRPIAGIPFFPSLGARGDF
jgi:hypothetical protein